MEARAQAAERAVRQIDIAAMAPRHIAGDREAESRTGMILVSGLVEPHKGPEHILALIG